MTSNEVVGELESATVGLLQKVAGDQESFTREQVLNLMHTAAMNGFQFGTTAAMSMVQGAMVVQMAKTSTRE